jgi:pimeloyl-ACP methyl ester carboxylesterase
MRHKCGGFAAATLSSAFLIWPACAQEAPPWQDSSKHKVHFISVEEGVQLEVLDWGGTGQSVVLLAGLGNTAHVFDDFADKLSGDCRVYGITRRGYGASSRPTSGYTAQRLADDVLNVLDSLKLVKPVLVGHSIAGQELTVLGTTHPNRIAGLVYLDAIADPTAHYPGYDALLEKLPAAMRNPPAPSESDLRSFRAYRAWQRRNNGAPFPEAELRNGFDSSPCGRVGEYRTPVSIRDAIIEGARKPEYARVAVPVLAFIAYPPSVEHQLQRHQVHGDRERKAVEQVYAADLYWIRKRIQTLQSGVPGARIVELRRANHFVFLSNEADVLRELRAFLSRLH